VQLQAAGVPWRTRMRLLDMTPSEIDRMDAERAADAMLSATLAPLPISEGGQLGVRGVTYTTKELPTDASEPTPPPPPPAPPPARPAPPRPAPPPRRTPVR
jgi:hypothetical protein